MEVDEHSISKDIAAVIKGHEYDLILAGNMAVDYGASQVAISVAEALEIPHVAQRLRIDDRTMKSQLSKGTWKGI